MEQLKYDIYICYSRKDYVDEHGNVNQDNPISVVTRILDAGGYTYFMDKEGIYSGDDFAERILRAIESSKLFLFLSSFNSNSSRWTLREIALAGEMNKQIVPIHIDNSAYSEGVLLRIAGLNSIKYANTSAFESTLLKTIGKLIGRNESSILTSEQRQLNVKSAEERRNGAKDYVPQKIDIDIFISYRRVDGRDYARNIMQALKIVGYPKVFFDYNSLRDGMFNTQILDAIYSCKDFILVISPLALKNCGREGDWVTKEIREAIKYHKKIIPVVIEDTFLGFPSDFPDDLSLIKDIQFHKLLTDEYFEDSIDKLAKRLSTVVSTDEKDVVSLQELQADDFIHKETVLYKIKVNRKCRLLIDDEEIQVIEASKLTKIPLPKGEYVRKVVDVENEKIFDEIPLILEHEKVDVVSLKASVGFFGRLLNIFR